jgi:hypothetical protein
MAKSPRAKGNQPMTNETVFQDFLGDTVKAAFAEQERVIGTLPDGSMILDLPPWARWLVTHPTEGLKAITADGKLVELQPPSIRRENGGE